MISNPSIYRIEHLERLPLKTPYPAQVQRIGYIMAHLPRDASLVVDFTGVGRGIYDMLVDAGLNPIGVTISSGFNTNWDGNLVTVPKSTLVSKLVARLHGGELFVQKRLEGWPVLRRELLNFRPQITHSGVETWNARSGEHDDLVLATALCAWYLSDGSQPYTGLLRYLAERAGADMGVRYAVGVDLGQSVDPTAICVMSRIDQPSQSDVRDDTYKRQFPFDPPGAAA
jgi:hypothetical protein